MQRIKDIKTDVDMQAQQAFQQMSLSNIIPNMATMGG